MIIIKKYRVLLLAFFLFSALALNAQQIQNVHFEQQGKQIHIYYDLIGEAGQKFHIKVYCSQDGGMTWGDALNKVSGAVGENKVPGRNNKIVWDVLAEREKLTGDVTFKVTAEESGKGVFTDERDGKVYKWVRIGNQVWMAENLNIGNRIDDKNSQKDNGRIEKYCYDGNSSNCDEYGGLYQWNEAMQYVTTQGAQGICPEGWHIPADGEWDELIDYLGGGSVAGGKMKEAGYDHWNPPNTGATNSSGFTALPGGTTRYYSSGSFYGLGYNGYFWSSSQYGASGAWYRFLLYNDDVVYRTNLNKTRGFSVRCLQD